MTPLVPPRPFDPAHVQRTLEALAGKGFMPPASAVPVLAAAFGNAPYLARLALREPETLARHFHEGPQAVLDAAMADAAGAAAAQSEAQAKALVQRARASGSLGGTSLGAKTREELADIAGDAVAAAVFGARQGDVVGPIRSDLGWHVVVVDISELEKIDASVRRMAVLIP